MSIFAGVRFVLFGFDSVSEAQYRAEIVRRGGTDVGRYDHSCTHVIVSGRIYDDPVCVAAREDGKTLVTEMWIDDSVDFGFLADATKMLYRPVRNLNGIPGSESLHICLTGYQKQERDDIMKLVSLMGAKFSKPLIANQVTHLICYKFEGEKYELARKVNIKLVNHRWLEDCLKEWEILPTDNYTKSGWELEILQAEDSEEETVEVDTKPLRHRSSVGTSTVGNGNTAPMISDLSAPFTGKDIVQKNMTLAKHSVAVDHHATSSMLLMMPSKSSSSGKELEACNLVREEVFQTTGGSKICAMDDGVSFIPCNSNIKGGIPSSTKSSSTSSLIGKELNSASYSRKSEKKSVSPQLSTNFQCSPQVSTKEVMSKVDFDISLLAPIEGETSNEPAKYQSPNANVNIYIGDASDGPLPQKRKVSPSQVGSKFPRIECQNPKASTLDSPHASIKVQEAKYHGGDDVTLGEADQTVQEVGLSDLTEKMQANPSKSKLCYRKSSTRWKTAVGTETSNTVFSPSERNNFENSGIKQAIGRQKTGTTNPATVESFATGFSPTVHGKVLPHLSLDDELLLDGGMHKITSSSKSDFGSLAVTDKLDETSLKDEGPDTFSGSVGGQNSITKDYDRIARDETPNLVNEGPASGYIIQKQERVLSSNSMEEKEKTIMSASNMLKESNKKVAPANRIKKAVAKKSTNIRTKVTGRNEGNVADGDKITTTHETAIENGELRVTKAMLVDGETGLMQEEGELLPEDNDDISQIKNTVSKSTSGRNKLSTASSKEGNVAYSDKTATTSEPAAVENGHFRDMNAKPSGNETRNNLMDEQGDLFPEDMIMEDTIRTKKTVGKKSTKGRTKSSTVSSKKGNVIDSNKSVITVNHSVESGKFRNMKTNPVPKDTRKKLTEASGSFFPNDVIMDNRMEVADHLVTASISNEASVDGLDISKDSEKENMPCDNVLNTDSMTNHHKRINKHEKQSSETPNGWGMEETNGKVCRLEPANFILSGHRTQRKEFQTAIRRLRGRVCRDSHQWSYQATHFIAPYPVRRTEKFFAAAAAGRWILKPDYLTASNEAGKFVDEEPFEVYDKGLTEDGTISLEAPRKWRLLRERTGHGAFYGMHIIIYGECIAPTLDTMKRVVKAGDGTILATSPPYTRFFKSGIDYAVISPSMLRVDPWVQEFLRHNIPCVTTDYLVEYVCKPGYSLEKHVLYRTHSWAEKSFANILRQSEESIKDAGNASEDSSGDLSCAVCGQKERGEVMLICGNDTGSAGCGIGTHIDCCDPPLEAVPEGDWFCSKCTDAQKKTPVKISKVVKSSSRRK